MLSIKFEQNFIVNRNDVSFLLNSINREYKINLSIVSILEDYIVFISKYEKENNINSIHELIKDIIKKENEERPFENVPDEEKRILRNIKNNVKNEHLELINGDLQELSSAITIRNRDYEKQKNINKWSLPVAIIGTIIAVIFGILSFRTVDYDRIESSLRNVIESSVEN